MNSQMKARDRNPTASTLTLTQSGYTNLFKIYSIKMLLHH